MENGRSSACTGVSASSSARGGASDAKGSADIMNLPCFKKAFADASRQIIGRPCPAGRVAGPGGLLVDFGRQDSDLEPEQNLLGSQGRTQRRRLRESNSPL